MIEVKYLERLDKIPLEYVTNDKSERVWLVSEDIEVTLSDGSKIIIEKGYDTDLSSVPKFAWSLMTPFDSGLFGDILHDKLWTSKLKEILRHGDSYKARLFADNERKLWREKLASQHKVKNYVTHKIIRIIGGYYYSGQGSIPV